MAVPGTLVPPPGTGSGDPVGPHHGPVLVRLLWLLGLAAVWWLLAAVPAAHADTTDGLDRPDRHHYQQHPHYQHHSHLIEVAVADQGGIVDAREPGGRGGPETRPAADPGGADTGVPCAAAAEPLTATTSSTGPVSDPVADSDPVESISAPATATDQVVAGSDPPAPSRVPPAGADVPESAHPTGPPPDRPAAQVVPVVWSVPADWVVPVSGRVPAIGMAAGPIDLGVSTPDWIDVTLGAYWLVDDGSDAGLADDQGGPARCEPVADRILAVDGTDRCSVVPPAALGPVPAGPAGELILVLVEPRFDGDLGAAPSGPTELPESDVARAAPTDPPPNVHPNNHHADHGPGPAADGPHRAPSYPFAPAGPATDGMGSGGSTGGHADSGQAVPPSIGSVAGPPTVRTRLEYSLGAERDRSDDLTESPD